MKRNRKEKIENATMNDDNDDNNDNVELTVRSESIKNHTNHDCNLDKDLLSPCNNEHSICNDDKDNNTQNQEQDSELFIAHDNNTCVPVDRCMRSLSKSPRSIRPLSPSPNNNILRQHQNPRRNNNAHRRIQTSTKFRTILDSPRRRGIQIPLPLLPQHLSSQSNTSNNRLSSTSSCTNINYFFNVNPSENDKVEPRDITLPDNINVDRDNNGIISNEIIPNDNTTLASDSDVSKKNTSICIKRIHTRLNCGKKMECDLFRVNETLTTKTTIQKQ